jgi:hypothetical protein
MCAPRSFRLTLCLSFACCFFCALQPGGQCAIQFKVDWVVSSTDTTNTVINTINSGPNGICTVSPTTCNTLNNNGYTPSGGCASRDPATVENPISCPAPGASPPPPKSSPQPPGAGVSDTWYGQWVVTPAPGKSCPTPMSPEVTAVLRAMENDLRATRPDVQSVTVTATGVTQKVGASFVWLRQMCMLTVNTLFFVAVFPSI